MDEGRIALIIGEIYIWNIAAISDILDVEGTIHGALLSDGNALIELKLKYVWASSGMC